MAMTARQIAGRAPAIGRLAPLGWFVLTITLTFLGLLLLTFVIGRVVPIDPVLAVVATAHRAKPMRQRGWRWALMTRF